MAFYMIEFNKMMIVSSYTSMHIKYIHMRTPDTDILCDSDKTDLLYLLSNTLTEEIFLLILNPFASINGFRFSIILLWSSALIVMTFCLYEFSFILSHKAVVC